MASDDNNVQGGALSLDEVTGEEDVLLEAAEEAQGAPAAPNIAAIADDFDPLATGQKIAKQTIVLELHVRKPGFTRSINAKVFQAATQGAAGETENKVMLTMSQPDPELLHISQDILDRKALKAIDKYDYQFINWLWERRVPCKMLANGMYLLPLDTTNEVDEALINFVKGRKQLIDALEAEYANLKADAKQRRGAFYNEADYPPFKLIRAKYRVEAQYLTFNVPAALEQINREIYNREMEKVKLQWADAAQEVREALRVAFRGLVEHFADRLGKDETGKAKTFHATAITKLQAFLDTFNNRDLTADAELGQLVAQAKELVKGVDPADVRKNEGLRSSLGTAFTQLATNAVALIEVKERKFALGEEEDEEAEPVVVEEAPALALEDVEETVAV